LLGDTVAKYTTLYQTTKPEPNVKKKYKIKAYS
jgi:hypothetical protein